MGMEWSISSAQGRVAEHHDTIGPDGQRVTCAPVNADGALKKRNEHLIGDINTRDADKFNAIFAASIEAFNAKQTRPSRKMGPESSNPERQKSYYDGIVDGTFCYGAGKLKERPIEEIVIQIGNKDDNGVTDKDFDIKHWKLLKASGKTAEASRYVIDHLNRSPTVERSRRILKRAVARIASYDPEHLVVVRADMHGDEPCGTVHAHVAVVLKATGYKTGMPERVASVKALAQMGFKKQPGTEYGIVQLHEKIKDIIEEEMLADALEYGYKPMRRKPDSGEHRKRSDVDVYREMAAQREQLERMQAELAAKEQQYAELIQLGRRKQAEMLGEDIKVSKPRRPLPQVGL